MRWVVIVSLVVLVAAGGGWGYIVWSGAQPAKKSAEVPVTGGKVATKSDQAIATRQGATRADTARGGSETYVPDDDYVEGEVVVANPPPGFESSVGALGFRITESTRLERLGMSLYRLEVPRGTSVVEARRRLAAEYPGLSVDANHNFRAQVRPEFPGSLPRPMIGWSEGKPGCGAGIRLGMIDGAIDTTHPALAGQDIEFRSFHRQGRKPGPFDHGTAVAAIMVGKPEWGGLLPGASLKAGNMFEESEDGKVVGSSIGLVKSVEWMIDSKVHVVNMSVAGADNKIVSDAIQKGMELGSIFVAAAGNWGQKGNAPAYPAAYPKVFAVTALDEKKLIYSHANSGKYIDFAAPGVKIWTAVPGGGRFQSGTSMASPFISTLVALENALAKGAQSPVALRDKLRGASVDLGPQGKDEIFGFGLVALEPNC